MSSKRNMNIYADPADHGCLEMLYKIYKSTITNKSDVAILFTHFIICIQCRMKCIDTGEEDLPYPRKHSEDHCALLPDGWNKNSDKYTLHYVLDNTIYILTAWKIQQNQNFKKHLIITLSDSENNKSSSFSLNAEAQIGPLEHRSDQLKALIPKATLLAERLQEELVKPVLEMRHKEAKNNEEVAESTFPNKSPKMIKGNQLVADSSFNIPYVCDFRDLRSRKWMRPRIYPTSPFLNYGGIIPNNNHLQPPDLNYGDFQ